MNFLPKIHPIKLVHLVLESLDHRSERKEYDIFFICLEKTHLDHLYKNRIIKLDITMAQYKLIRSRSDIMNTVCAYVLSKFTNLICLKFHPYPDYCVDGIERLSFRLREPPRFFSSSLMELHVNVEDFTDCLNRFYLSYIECRI